MRGPREGGRGDARREEALEDSLDGIIVRVVNQRRRGDVLEEGGAESPAPHGGALLANDAAEEAHADG